MVEFFYSKISAAFETWAIFDNNIVRVWCHVPCDLWCTHYMHYANPKEVLWIKTLLLQRPSFCPIHGLTPSIKSELLEATRDHGVDVGCALILESCDGRVLLTCRAAHLRTFPGVWVPPGQSVYNYSEHVACTSNSI